MEIPGRYFCFVFFIDSEYVMLDVSEIMSG